MAKKASPGDKRLGNQFWTARYTHGRKPKIKTPTLLRKACTEYLEWVQSNPLWDNQVIAFQGEGYDHPVAKMRAPTMQGLCLFLGISRQTWTNWKTSQKGFLEIQEWVEEAIYTWKLEGAAAGLLNPAIIARDLKLKEYSDVTSDDEAISEIVVSFDKPRSRAVN